jgi:two-component system cell cycle sensor histidine kinase PleC
LVVALVGVALLAIFGVLCGIVWRAEQRMRRTHAHNLELTAAQARAEAASRAKSVFLANMSHELRTPLNAIIGFAAMIKDVILGPIGHPKYKEFAVDIHNAGEHLLRIIGDVLDLAKIEVGNMTVTTTRVELRSLAEGVLAMLAPRAASAGIVMSVDGATSLDIETDETKVRQILLNLISNALKFTPAGGKVTVSLQDDAARGVVEMAIADTGIGIRAEDIPAALAPFGQVDQSLSRQHEGTGLGLPLSKKFAQLLGGDLKLSSTPGTGTCVRVTIPHRLTPQALLSAGAA